MIANADALNQRRRSGASWNDIAATLAFHGVFGSDGRPHSSARVRSNWSRVQCKIAKHPLPGSRATALAKYEAAYAKTLNPVYAFMAVISALDTGDEQHISLPDACAAYFACIAYRIQNMLDHWFERASPPNSLEWSWLLKMRRVLVRSRVHIEYDAVEAFLSRAVLQGGCSGVASKIASGSARRSQLRCYLEANFDLIADARRGGVPWAAIAVEVSDLGVVDGVRRRLTSDALRRVWSRVSCAKLEAIAAVVSNGDSSGLPEDESRRGDAVAQHHAEFIATMNPYFAWSAVRAALQSNAKSRLPLPEECARYLVRVAERVTGMVESPLSDECFACLTPAARRRWKEVSGSARRFWTPRSVDVDWAQVLELKRRGTGVARNLWNCKRNQVYADMAGRHQAGGLSWELACESVAEDFGVDRRTAERRIQAGRRMAST
ncbi:hypothetical protein JMJ56_29805 [Belnapia sp. T18]|uniref:Uncharacterized protein n=1 Tax=Belnapia arida TaxID=2804533 RepID=A0ABS1UBV3_9PROT|nr:hypothetical protein [Belnapia arida]MBL6082175.1 hypothetical protein [Belnapia arida]